MKSESPTVIRIYISVRVATPCYLLRIARRFGGNTCPNLCDINTTNMKSSGTPSTSKIIVICDVADNRSSFIYRVKMKALRPSETSGTTQRTTQCHIPQYLSNIATSRPKRYTSQLPDYTVSKRWQHSSYSQ
jgi:hypothetical protein